MRDRRTVTSRVRALISLAITLALGVGNLSLCAGWQPTPEARMACCVKGAGCPMHASESGGSGAARTITQAQADRCCAGSTDRAPASSGSPVFTLVSVAALPFATDSIVSTAAPALEEWRALVPHPVSPVPRHLLLTVLLV